MSANPRSPQAILALKRNKLALLEANIKKFPTLDPSDLKNQIRLGILTEARDRAAAEVTELEKRLNVKPKVTSTASTQGMRQRLASVVAQDKPNFSEFAAKVKSNKAGSAEAVADSVVERTTSPKPKPEKGFYANRRAGVKAALKKAKTQMAEEYAAKTTGDPPVRELKTQPKPKPKPKVIAEAAKPKPAAPKPTPIREVKNVAPRQPFTGQYSWWADDPLTIQEEAAEKLKRDLLNRMHATDRRFGASLATRYGDEAAQLGFDMGQGRTHAPVRPPMSMGFDPAGSFQGLADELPGPRHVSYGVHSPAGMPPGIGSQPGAQLSMLTPRGQAPGGVLPRVAGQSSAIQDLLPSSKWLSPRALKFGGVAKSIAGPGALALTAATMMPGAYADNGFGFEDKEGKPTFLKWLAEKAADMAWDDDKTPTPHLTNERGYQGGSRSSTPKSMVYAVKTNEMVDESLARKKFLQKRGYQLSGASGALNQAAAARDFVQPSKSHPTTTSFLKSFGMPTSQRDPFAFNAIYGQPKWMQVKRT